MKQIIKEGEKNDSVRRTFECTDCGCIFTSDTGIRSCDHFARGFVLTCRCPWCHSEMAYEKKE